MNLFLHVGTNKTGSSFIQTFLIRNKARLQSDGVFLPASRSDQRMKEGKISPGNGAKLAEILAREDRKELRIYLGSVIRDGRAQGADKILLSNEVLIRLFSNQAILKLLKEVATEVGFAQIRFLCFLRNPHDHALSLYKHRAKFGAHCDFTGWFEKDYETLRLFGEFLGYFDDKENKWLFRLYKKDSDYLIDVCTREWLGITIPSGTVPGAVNRSLSLTEIYLMQRVVQVYPDAGSFLHHEFVQLKGKKGSDSTHLLRLFSEAATGYFKPYQTVIEGMKMLLPITDREQFGLTSLRGNQGSENGITLLSFEKEQLHALEKGLDAYRKTALKRRIRKRLGKAFRYVLSMTKKRGFDSKRYGGALTQL